jgi:N-dimethylarginine dimethylaminohydrolase
MALTSTLMGEGWKSRTGSLSSELGTFWKKAGVVCETDFLKAVLLVEPPESFKSIEDPSAFLMLELVDFERLNAQYQGLCAAYTQAGVQVQRFVPPVDASPNLIFARDLFWMTPEGAVIGRMASRQRAGEERFATLALAERGIPIRATIGGSAWLEGADLLWLKPDLVLAGIGRRTTDSAIDQLQALFPAIQFLRLPVPLCVQHLLGAINFLTPTCAALHPAAAPEVVQVLASLGITPLWITDDIERDQGRAMNFVCLKPGAILMPSGCPKTRKQFEQAGIACLEVEVSEYLKAAGGPGCITGIIERSG